MYTERHRHTTQQWLLICLLTRLSYRSDFSRCVSACAGARYWAEHEPEPQSVLGPSSMMPWDSKQQHQRSISQKPRYFYFSRIHNMLEIEGESMGISHASVQVGFVEVLWISFRVVKFTKYAEIWSPRKNEKINSLWGCCIFSLSLFESSAILWIHWYPLKKLTPTEIFW